MRRFALCSQALGVVLAAGLWPAAQAVVTYEYVGVDYAAVTGSYTTSMHITGSLSLNATLGPGGGVDLLVAPSLLVEFSFDDGLGNLFTETNSHIDGFQLLADGSGDITVWNIQLLVDFPVPAAVGDKAFALRTVGFGFFNADVAAINECDTLNADGTCDDFSALDAAATVDPDNPLLTLPGDWTLARASASVPEPAAVILMVLGLAGIGGTRLLMRWRRALFVDRIGLACGWRIDTQAAAGRA